MFLVGGVPTSSTGPRALARPPRWTISLGHNANVEGIAFGYRSHDLHLLAENGNLYLVAADAYAR